MKYMIYQNLSIRCLLGFITFFWILCGFVSLVKELVIDFVLCHEFGISAKIEMVTKN